jgi:cleavage and polyadenylation specificity factor subunit 3
MSSHSHSHGDSNGDGESNGNGEVKTRRAMDPKERLSRLFLLLEAQFGSDAITPIETLPSLPSTKDKNEEGSDDEDEDETAQEKEMQKVLERLHTLGIPVPGIEIKLSESPDVKAKVWLEDLRVECSNAIWRGRVENVVREAVEGVKELWG